MTDLITRALNYVATLPPAVSGERGHDAAFRVAATLVHGFALSEAEAMPIMEHYNASCVPPWSRKELEHKLRSAAEWTKYDKPRGHLAGASRRAAAAQPSAPRPKKSISFSWFNHEPAVMPSSAQNEPSVTPAAGTDRPSPATDATTDEPAADPPRPAASVASDDPSPIKLTEDHRIAGELVKLHRSGVIKGADDPEAVFYANLVHLFGAML